MRYCTCGAAIDITGLRKSEAEKLMAEWESKHWYYRSITIDGQVSFVPIGRLGHEYADGPVTVRIGEKMTTGGEHG